MTIPVSYPALIGGKLIICGFLSVFLGMASTFFTVAAELLVGFPGFSLTALIRALIQITFNTLFLYLSLIHIRYKALDAQYAKEQDALEIEIAELEKAVTGLSLIHI